MLRVYTEDWHSGSTFPKTVAKLVIFFASAIAECHECHFLKHFFHFFLSFLEKTYYYCGRRTKNTVFFATKVTFFVKNYIIYACLT